MKNKWVLSLCTPTALILFLGTFQYSEATSGACSSHGGVNCSASVGVYGQAICNDGWSDSSVGYSSMRECEAAKLNQECVAYTTANIRAKDNAIKEIDKNIEDYKVEMQKNNDTSDPAVKQQMSLHLNYLYTLRSRQNNFYQSFIDTQCTNSALNASCVESNGPNWEMKSVDATTGNIKCGCAAGYVRGSTGSSCIAQQFQQSAPPVGGGGSIPTPGLQCNGKSWNTCPAGYNFFCPSSGDASCTPQQQPQMVTPPLGGEGVGVTQEPPKVTSTPVKDKPTAISAPPTKKKSPVVSNSVASASDDIPQLTNAPVTPVQTKKKGIWSWFKGLFGF